MDRLKELLIAIKGIVAEDHAKQIEQTKHGEKFNIFKVLKAQRNEMLHSAFIAELLNPKGSHGANDTFLQIFKTIFIDELIDDNGDICSNEIWEFDTENAAVYIEYDIDENGRIDILIENNGKGIIIENKIDASDQKGQLFRYNKFAKSRYGSEGNYKIIYLTLEGIDASEESLNNSNINYITASYREDIWKWINKCIEKSTRFPFVRETLLQYMVNLKEIFTMMNEESITKLAEIATSENFIDSTLAIIKNQRTIQKTIIENFIKQMQKIAKAHGLECTSRGDLPNLEDYSGLLFYYPKGHWALYIGAELKHLQSYGAIYGIIQRNDSKKIRITQKKLREIKPVWDYQDQNYPLGCFSLYQHKETRKRYNWSDWKVSEDMASGEFANWIEECIFPEIFEGKNALGKKNLLRYIERITKED